MTTIAHHLRLVRQRMDAACLAAGRDPDSVRLLAVAKTFGAGAVTEAIAAGQTAFGENYIAEGVDKIDALRRWQAGSAGQPAMPGGKLEWHCIGPVQSNKTRLVATHFDWVQSVDRLKTAQRLSEQRPADLPPLQVCLQINVDGGVNKSGLAPDEVLALVREVARLPRLVVRGLMAIPEPAIDFVAACALHASAKAIFDEINAAGALPAPMDTLSLGMTADLEAAIHAGSTMVRVGSAIFGNRG